MRLANEAQRRVPGSASVWLPGSGRAAEKARELQLPTRYHNMPDIRRQSKLRRAAMNVQTGIRLRRQRPGILHVHSLLTYAALPIACALSGLKRIVHVHSEQDAETIRWAFRRPPELIITCARFLADQVQAALPEQSQRTTRLVAVPNCIETDLYRPGDRCATKQQVGAPPNRPLLLMLANLTPHKGQTTAIHATAELKQRGIDVLCWLGGVERDQQGGFQKQLEELIAARGVADRVRLLGFRSDGATLLRAADFFLLPSMREGLPLSVLEAQASGVPVLAAPSAGTREIIDDGATGYLIAADDAMSYADRIARLLEQPETYRRIAEQARRQCVHAHSMDAFVRQIWELYAGLIDCGQ